MAVVTARGSTGPSPLLVIVHGHGDGAIPQLLLSLLEGLQQQRQAPVWIQALTAEPLELPSAQHMLMVPLLLTPGSHVRCDVPLLRQRFRAQGHQVTLSLFGLLGSLVATFATTCGRVRQFSGAPPPASCWCGRPLSQHVAVLVCHYSVLISD